LVYLGRRGTEKVSALADFLKENLTRKRRMPETMNSSEYLKRDPSVKISRPRSLLSCPRGAEEEPREAFILLNIKARKSWGRNVSRKSK